jgi:DASS family divalent anion:Na+ symporter
MMDAQTELLVADTVAMPACLPACLTSPAGVLTWRDCLEYTPAWDTLIWFAILISMSNGLNESGLINSFASMVGSQLNALNLGWQVGCC